MPRATTTSAEKPKPEDTERAPVDGTSLAHLAAWVKGHQGELSVTVADANSGVALLTHEGNVPRNPASVSKLLTARVALETLGMGHRFTTTIRGTMVDGRVNRLLIRSDGNPELTLDELRGMLAELRALGLVAVTEGIFIDQSAFGDDYVPPAFAQQPEEWAAFRAPVCATAIDRNRLTVQVQPTSRGQAARVSVSPPGIAEVTGTVHTVEGGQGKLGVGVTVKAAGDKLTVRVTGKIEEQASPYFTLRRVEDPRKLIGRVTRELLREAGIQVPSRVELWTGTDPVPPVLVSRQSATLPTILRSLGKDSDNFTAEMLLLAIGAKAKSIGKSEVGAGVVLEYLAAQGPVEQGTKFINGSGLFDANRLSTDLVARLLTEAKNNTVYAPEYLSQLSVGARDGTLKNRFTELPKDCIVRGKTGTLKATSALSGYVDSRGKRPLAFAVIVENITDLAALKPEIDAFVTSLCEL